MLIDLGPLILSDGNVKPLRLEIKKKLTSRSDRVKSVDLHDSEPWVLSALYNGNLMIWNYETQQLLKSFETTDLPVRCGKFIERKQWVVAISDDMMMRVYNYNTMEKVHQVEAHTDYIRYVEVHPIKPLVLTTSDDSQIKAWDWEKNWQCVMTFEGHTNFVMMARFNPKDTNTFATASLDKTVKVWGLTANHPHFSLEGHERGVNCVDYYPGGDRPYLITGADDRMVKIWDYQTKACVQTLDGHTHNINCVAFHPSEDGTVRIWHSTTYRAETTLNYGMERSWSIAVQKGNNKVAIGYDEGTIVIRLGKEMPVISMDQTGKVVWALNNDVKTTKLGGWGSEVVVQDGERLPVAPKDLGNCELYPQSLKHNNNGRLVVICGDGEYIIYTSQALRNKSFGSALDFVWSATGTGDYAVRESISRIKVFKNFKEHKADKPKLCTAEGLFGGHLVGVRGSDCVVFYDWDELRLVRKIDVLPRNVFWSDAGDLVAIACDDCFYVLRYARDVTAAAFANGTASPDEGIEGSFDLLHEISEKVRTGQWVGDCFVYTNSNGRLNYYVGGEVMTVCHLPHTMYMLGYLAKDSRVYLVDKSLNMYSYSLNMTVLEYQTAVVRGDFDGANEILKNVPKDQMDNISRFLESQGYKEEALAVSTDPDQRFDLAVQLNRLDVAHQIMSKEIGDTDTTDGQHKWKQLSDLALAACNLSLAEECAIKSNDLSGLLLLYSCKGDQEGMERLHKLATEQKKYNVAFLCLFLQGRLEECVSLLIDSGRIPEAAFFARTYAPSQIDRVLALWKRDVAKISTRLAAALADPKSQPDMFPDLQFALRAEETVKKMRASFIPGTAYLQLKDTLNVNMIEEVKKQGAEGLRSSPAVQTSAGANISDADASEATSVREQKLLEERTRKDAEETARREAEERKRKEAEEAARLRKEAELKASQEAELQAKKEHEERLRREAHAKAQREAEEKARREAEDKARREAEAQARREAEERAKKEEERARREAEERARLEAESRARQEAEERARKQEEERLRREAEERLRRDAEERMRKESEERMRREAEELARAQAAERARREAEERAREEEEKARREAQERLRREAEEKLRRDTEERMRQEAAQRARKEAEEKLIREREEQVRLEALKAEQARAEEAQRAQAAAFATVPPAVTAVSAVEDDFLDEETQKIAAELNDDELDFGDDDADWGEM